MLSWSSLAVSITEMVSFQFSERPRLKSIKRWLTRKTSNVPFGFLMWVYGHVHSWTHMHTPHIHCVYLKKKEKWKINLYNSPPPRTRIHTQYGNDLTIVISLGTFSGFWWYFLPGMPGGVFRYFPLKCWITTSHFSVDSILGGRKVWGGEHEIIYFYQVVLIKISKKG